MEYNALKLVHVGAAALSLSVYLLRCIWLEMASPLLRARLTRILPHVIDSVLLGSAIWLAMVTGFSPIVHPWLAMKIILLLVYIPLGALGLKSTLPVKRRRIFQVMALSCFASIVSLALFKPYL